MGNTLDTPITEKSGINNTFGMNGCRAVREMQGWRLEMEDQYVSFDGNNYCVLGVADGHGGKHCADFIHANFQRIFETELAKEQDETPETFKRVLYATFFALDEEFLKDEKLRKDEEEKDQKLRKSTLNSGSTLVVSVITATHFVIANAGDSRAIVFDKETRAVIFGTDDHKPQNDTEHERITKAGGFVHWKRVDGDLAVSRAIGDFPYKNKQELSAREQKVSCEPDITIVARTQNSTLVLACDGVWDVMSNEDVAQFMSTYRIPAITVSNMEPNLATTVENPEPDSSSTPVETDISSTAVDNTSVPTCEILCAALIDRALELNSKDNLSAAIFISV